MRQLTDGVSVTRLTPGGDEATWRVLHKETGAYVDVAESEIRTWLRGRKQEVATTWRERHRQFEHAALTIAHDGLAEARRRMVGPAKAGE